MGSAWKRLTALSTSLVLALGLSAVQAQQVEISQISMELDDGLHPNTDWGSVDVTYTGSSEVQYFNLNVDGNWVVQNIPVLSAQGIGSQTQTFNFPIGINGVAVSSVNFGFSLTTSLESLPLLTNFGVTPSVRDIAEFGGVAGTPIVYSAATALVGAQAPVTRFATARPGYPNQESGPNECGPVAVSNSLQYLNTQFNLGLTAEQTSIDTMKQATGFDGKGVPFNWYTKKDTYMQDNKYPIKTTATHDPEDLFDALENGFDVEICAGGHLASVVGITRLGGGIYSIDVAHDTDQSKEGGTKVETVIFDSNAEEKQVTAAKWLHEVNLNEFVIEQPTAPDGSSGLMAGGMGAVMLLGSLRRRRCQARGRRER